MRKPAPVFNRFPVTWARANKVLIEAANEYRLGDPTVDLPYPAKDRIRGSLAPARVFQRGLALFAEETGAPEVAALARDVEELVFDELRRRYVIAEEGDILCDIACVVASGTQRTEPAEYAKLVGILLRRGAVHGASSPRIYELTIRPNTRSFADATAQHDIDLDFAERAAACVIDRSLIRPIDHQIIDILDLRDPPTPTAEQLARVKAFVVDYTAHGERFPTRLDAQLDTL